MSRSNLQSAFRYASLFTQLGLISDEAKKKEIYNELKKIESYLNMTSEEILSLAIKNKK